jgi:RHS repeat-associated protein
MNRALVTALRRTLVLAWAIVLLSSIAWQAQAHAAEWGIEEKNLAQLGLSEETVTSSKGPIALETTLLGSKVIIACELAKSKGRMIAPKKDEATIELSKCATTINGKAAPACKPKEPVTAKVSSELREDEAKLVVRDILKPQVGTTFMKYELGEECSIGELLTVTGESAAELPQGMAVSKAFVFSLVIANAAGTKLTVNSKQAANLAGTLLVELSGANTGKKWGSCLACSYTASQGYGGGNPGAPGLCKKCLGDPIDVATGNLSEEQADIPALGGRGPALKVVRSYNSQLAATQAEGGPFGFGWTGPYNAYLVIDEKAKTATVHQDNGSTTDFTLTEGVYTAPSWIQAKLAKEGTGYLYTLPDQSKLEFNSSGQLTKEIDRHKNAITLTYDKESHLETAKSTAGRTLTFKFKEGHVESIKDPLGHEVKYAYESGNLVKVTLPGETEPNWIFKYDASHRLTEMTDGRGGKTTNEYDGSSRVTLQKDPLERKRKFEYKESGGIKETTITEPNGSTTVEIFNAAGEPTSITRASGTALAATTTYEYDYALHRTGATDPNNHVTKYGYDAEGNRISEVDPNGNEAKWAYNATHDVTSETTPKKEVTTITRNTAGDPETIKRPAPGGKTQETKFKYAENGDLEETTDPLGHVTKYSYDKYGDKEAETDPEGDKQTFKYDEDGRIIAEVPPRGNEEGAEASKFETKTKRDSQGRPEVVTDPLGHETKYVYDANGNLKEQVNPNGHATKYVYDAGNERTEVKAANGNTTKTAYDSEGDVESRTDGNEHTTEYEHNALNELTKTTDPLERETTRTYDAAGNLKELKDPEGRTTTYTYDPGNRLKEVKYSEAATKPVTYVYDADGNVTEMKDGTGTTKNTYDELDRLTESTNGNGKTVKYAYDLSNKRTEVVYPNGKAVTQSFDKAGRLEAVKDWLGNETKFSYNRDSMPKATTFPATSTDKDSYEYNNADRLTKTTMARGEETLTSISYGRTAAGQLEFTTQKGLPGPEKPEYGYDSAERMTSGAGSSFEYDAADNPTKVVGTAQKFDEANELTEAGTTKYAYDKLGERTKTEPNGGTATTYGYDQAGNLISVTKAGSIEDTYAYNGRGLRMSQTISGTTTQMVWNTAESLPLLLYDGANYYLYGPEGLPFEQIASETPTYLHHDQQGSTRLLTNSEGKATGRYTYTPYGAVEEHTESATTPLGYNGQYRSDDTGLIYLRMRVYDPVTAQFLSVDPLLSKTGEAYVYAGDDPVNRGDPSGEEWSWTGTFRVTSWVLTGAAIVSTAVGAIPLAVGLQIASGAIKAGVGAYEVSQGNHGQGIADIGQGLLYIGGPVVVSSTLLTGSAAANAGAAGTGLLITGAAWTTSGTALQYLPCPE